MPTSRRKRVAPNTAALRKLQSDWEQLQASWRATTLPKSYQKTGTIPAATPTSLLLLLTPQPIRRDTGTMIPSRDSTGGNTAKTPSPQYTGTAIVGIATLHKSNAIPVFSEQEAIEVARMRRG